jgi:hypothetical protein
MAPELGRSATEEEGRAARDADHPTIESASAAVASISRQHGHVDVALGNRLDVITLTVAVEEHDGHRGVTSTVERLMPALVGQQVRAQKFAEVVPERDHVVIIALGGAGLADPVRSRGIQARHV